MNTTLMQTTIIIVNYFLIMRSEISDQVVIVISTNFLIIMYSPHLVVRSNGVNC